MLINGSYISWKNNQKIILKWKCFPNNNIVKESFLRKDNPKVNSRIKFQ